MSTPSTSKGGDKLRFYIVQLSAFYGMPPEYFMDLPRDSDMLRVMVEQMMEAKRTNEGS